MAYNRKLLYTKSFPSWNTPGGNLGNVINDAVMTSIQLVATEINEPGSIITYAVTTGSLPTGLTLSSSGEISGTPTGYTSLETINFTVTATDDEGETAVRDFSINILIPYDIDFLVVAGGGAGAPNHGAGGAGGLRTSYGAISGGGSSVESPLTVILGNQYSIIVGSGGNGYIYNGPIATNGGDSSFGPITSTGGGHGGGWSGGNVYPPSSGGSGGGGGYYSASNFSFGAPGTLNQGFSGGNGFEGSSSQLGGGGGGGASAPGTNYSGTTSGSGGNGLQSSITGSAIYYAGGGSGGNQFANGAMGAPGLGGGGRGSFIEQPASHGVANTGGGGGGSAGGAGTSGNGGSGIVILRMPTSGYSGITTGNPTVTTDGSDTILTYTGSGTYTA
jgi:hypothetical protein